MRDNRRFTNTNEPGITKVQPVPSRTPDTETLRLEKGVATLRKARKDRRVREFVQNRIVPLMQGKPDQTSNLRVVLKELDMTEEGKENTYDGAESTALRRGDGDSGEEFRGDAYLP